MGDLDNEFLSEYLKADDFEIGTVLEFTITKLEKVVFDDPDTKQKVERFAMSVAESKQKMKLNNSSGRLFKKLFGTNSADWLGKKVKFIVSQSGVGAYFSAIEPKGKAF